MSKKNNQQNYNNFSELGENIAGKIAEGLGAASDAIEGAISGLKSNGQPNQYNGVKYNGKFNYDPHTGKPINQKNTPPQGVNYSSKTTNTNQAGNYQPPNVNPPTYNTSTRPPGVTPTTPPTMPNHNQPNGNVPQKNMMMVREPSVAKYYITGIVAILYATILPMYLPLHFVVFALVTVLTFAASSKLIKGKKKFVEIEEPVESHKPSKTGNPDVDKVIDEGHEYIAKLKELNRKIPDRQISSYITRMEVASEGIFKYITSNPVKAPQIHTFMNYYLPTTMKLLTSYHRLDSQPVKGENITSTMVDIERMLGTVATAFEKQLDSLFGEEALDIGTDISVFESMLKQEGFAPDNMDITATKKGASEQEAPETEESVTSTNAMQEEIDVSEIMNMALDNGELDTGEPKLTLNPDESSADSKEKK